MENLNEILNLIISVLCMAVLIYALIVLRHFEKDRKKARKYLDEISKD